MYSSFIKYTQILLLFIKFNKIIIKIIWKEQRNKKTRLIRIISLTGIILRVKNISQNLW